MRCVGVVFLLCTASVIHAREYRHYQASGATLQDAKELLNLDAIYQGDSPAWPFAETACDAAHIRTPPSIEEMSCTLVAQARQAFATAGGRLHGACLSTAGLMMQASNTHQRGLTMCDHPQLDQDRMGFIYRPHIRRLLPMSWLTTQNVHERFLRSCRILDPPSTTAVPYPVFGWKQCSITEHNRFSRCQPEWGDICPRTAGLQVLPELHILDEQFDLVKADPIPGVFRIRSAAHNLCVRFTMKPCRDPNPEPVVHFGSCEDDSGADGVRVCSGNTFRIHLNPNRRCFVKCAKGYAADETLIHPVTGVTKFDAHELLSCPSGPRPQSWTFLKDLCPRCAQGFTRQEDGLCQPKTSNSSRNVNVNNRKNEL